MANELFNFTRARLLKIKPPKTGTDNYRDAKETGLTLRVGYGGSKVFCLYKKINSKPKRIKLGTFPYITIEEAREKAFEIKRQIEKGSYTTKKAATSLAVESSLDAMTFKQFLDKYINDYAKIKIKRWEDVIATMDRQAKHLYDVRISDITRDDIQKVFNELTESTGQNTANKFAKRMSSIFNIAIK